MKKKRFIKLLMASGLARNAANEIAGLLPKGGNYENMLVSVYLFSNRPILPVDFRIVEGMERG